MRALALVLAILALSLAPADARHRHWRKSYGKYEMPPAAAGEAPAAGRGGPTVAALVPSDWIADPEKKDWKGRRFVSPDGSSWVALYKADRGNESVADHMKAVAFAPEETITYLRGERTWIAVSGYRQSHIFYRKAIMACGGKSWNHVALEYPIEAKERMDKLVAAMAQAIDNTQTDCGEATVSSQ